ncbi:methyltransferase domain-containing protein [Actinobacteria bacterium YIM 96077]|uniref:Methyltransferase n=1 Tax=Phytoactinopolyspora halophila TaxID=1981511 RepID=A0A329QCZ4_9ACTN|nr:methyltransferase [Phytoactinopolyspora halophila]AYY14178.1 methyltransferase domain-containing protein [Actinobacteria bacterium YIM 96077]RAW10230.1 methyltransferase [Phytoactinopolyspora halophila]
MTHEPAHAAGPSTIMEMTSGLWVSKTLAAALEVDVFGALAERPGSTVEELASQLNLRRRPTRSLVLACAALGLLIRSGDGYSNSALADRYLVRGRPDYFGGWVEFIDRHNYPGWMRLAESLRANRPTTWEPDQQQTLFEDADPVLLETFWEAMAAVSSVTAREVGKHVDLTEARSLLDVGGGGAAWDIELCRMYPQLRAAVYDLPHVCELTQAKIDAAGLEDRISTIPGDFFADDKLPDGYDLMVLSSILHNWNDGDDRVLLDKCFAALPPGGRLIIGELLIDDTEDGPLNAALMGLAMQVEMWGRSFTEGELRTWLLEAGFATVDVVRFTAPVANGAVIARKS